MHCRILNHFKIQRMQNTGLIKTMLYLMIGVCLYQFALIIPTKIVETNARTAAVTYASSFPKEEEQKIEQQYVQQYLDSISNEVIFSIPWIKHFTYNEIKNQQLKLGLDLQGGMQVTIDFEIEDFIKRMADDPLDSLFLKAIELTKASTTSSPEKYIAAFFDHYQTIETEQNIRSVFSKHPLIKAKCNSQTSLLHLEQIIDQFFKETIASTHHLLRERIDGLGLAQTIIHLDEDKQLIQIEIPGVQNPERVRSILLATASLEFWEVYRITDFGFLDRFIEADQLLSQAE